VGAAVTAITVSPPYRTLIVDPTMIPYTPEQHAQDWAALADKYVEVAREAAALAGVACESVHLVSDHPYQAIIDTARGKGCDLICMASHGRKGVAALVLGSETSKVLTHSTIPVLVCR
jgi:nucleotide-binding universal stress UspA family protein